MELPVTHPDWLRDAVGEATAEQIISELSLTFRAVAELTRICREYINDPLGRELARASARVGHIQLMRLARTMSPDVALLGESEEGKA